MQFTKSLLCTLAISLTTSFFEPIHAGKIGDKWAELKTSLEPAKIKQKIREKVTELDIGFDLDLVDLDLFDGAGLAANYRYEVEPSYNGGWYTRVDKWKIKADLKPGDFLSEHKLPIGFSVRNDTELVFVRQFKSQKKALKALPYHPGKTPTSAKRALEKLKPGDFAAIPARLNLLISANLGAQSGAFHAGLGTHYLLSGEFQVQVFRLPDNKVRMKLIALRKKRKGISGSLEAGFEVFSINVLGHEIDHVLDLDLAEIGIHKEDGNLFLMDYIMDLDSKAGRDAYNQVLNASMKFKQASVMDPFSKDREVEDSVIASLALAEAVHEEDLSKDEDDRRVKRLFKGLNDYQRNSSRLKLGLLLAKLDNKKAFTQNRIAWYDQNDTRRDYLFPVYSHEKKRSFLFGVFKAQELESFSALFPTDSEGKVNGFSDYGYSYELKDKAFYGHEQEDLKEKIRILLPKNQEPDFADWTEEEKRKNARVKLEVFFHEASLQHLSGLSEDELYLGLAHLLTRVEKLNRPHQGGKPGHHRPRPGAGWKASEARKTAHKVMLAKNYDRYWRSMNKMVEKLSQTLDARIPNSVSRVERLFDLRGNRAFEKLGIALLIQMLPTQNREELVYISSDWLSEETQPLHLRFGTHKNSELYEELKWVESILAERSTNPQDLPTPQATADDHQKRIFEELYQ